jgi:hypothetical protein
MATVATQKITTTGAALTYSAASGGGDKFTPGPYTYMHAINGGGSPITATLTTPGTVDGLAVADRTVAIPAGESRMVKLPTELYKGAQGLGDVSWSGTTSVTFAVVSF